MFFGEFMSLESRIGVQHPIQFLAVPTLKLLSGRALSKISPLIWWLEAVYHGSYCFGSPMVH